MLWTLITTALALAALWAPKAEAADYVVITHPGLTLSADDIKDVYIGQMQMAGSIRLVPVDNGAAQEAFLARVVRMEVGRYNTAWIKKAYRDGVTAPALKAGDAEVLEFVQRTPGAVGYVRVVAAGVNVVVLK